MAFFRSFAGIGLRRRAPVIIALKFPVHLFTITVRLNEVAPESDGDEAGAGGCEDGPGKALSHLQEGNYVPSRLYGTNRYLPPGAATFGANISNTLGDRSR